MVVVIDGDWPLHPSPAGVRQVAAMGSLVKVRSPPKFHIPALETPAHASNGSEKRMLRLVPRLLLFATNAAVQLLNPLQYAGFRADSKNGCTGGALSTARLVP